MSNVDKLKSFKYQINITRAVDQEFESMAFDINHSVRESNPLSYHSTVHTLSTFVLVTTTTFVYLCDHGPRADCWRSVGFKLNHNCDM